MREARSSHILHFYLFTELHWVNNTFLPNLMRNLKKAFIILGSLCSFTRSISDCNDRGGCHRCLFHRMGTGPIGCDCRSCSCEHPLLQLHHVVHSIDLLLNPFLTKIAFAVADAPCERAHSIAL